MSCMTWQHNQVALLISVVLTTKLVLCQLRHDSEASKLQSRHGNEITIASVTRADRDAFRSTRTDLFREQNLPVWLLKALSFIRTEHSQSVMTEISQDEKTKVNIYKNSVRKVYSIPQRRTHSKSKIVPKKIVMHKMLKPRGISSLFMRRKRRDVRNSRSIAVQNTTISKVNKTTSNMVNKTTSNKVNKTTTVKVESTTSVKVTSTGSTKARVNIPNTTNNASSRKVADNGDSPVPTMFPIPPEWSEKGNNSAFIALWKKISMHQLLERNSQWAYLCCVFLLTLLSWAVWCTGMCHQKKIEYRTWNHQNSHSYSSIKDIFRRRMKYLPDESFYEEIFVRDQGTDP